MQLAALAGHPAQPINFLDWRQKSLFNAHETYKVSVTPEITAMLDAGAVVAMSVSGGKDGNSAAIRLVEYLNEVGHTGPRLLIHSDLGVVEWKDSLPSCERLARRLGLELVVVRRNAGDMMDRWETRWRNNLSRYSNLECVKLILPWSTPSMRFCTSELKSAVISSELTRRFPGQKIITVTGVRHDESLARSKMAIAAPDPRLSARKCSGMVWNPIITWTTPEVFQYHKDVDEPLHEAYTKYHSSRVSCTFCIMGSLHDLNASASCPDNADIYRRMVQLEIDSSFAFQGARWLGDIAPHLLTDSQRAGLARAKEVASIRMEAEKWLPDHLLFKKGWPTDMPTYEEAVELARMRRTVAEALCIEINYTSAETVISRYQELMNS